MSQDIKIRLNRFLRHHFQFISHYNPTSEATEPVQLGKRQQISHE